MAVSKVVLNDRTLIDVTQDTVESNKMTSGTTAHKNDGTVATGNIATKSAADLTVSGKTVTVPAGLYTSQVTKDVYETTHPTPIMYLNSSTGVVTAYYDGESGYVEAITRSSSYQLTTAAAATITPTTTTQTAVNSGVYTLGAIKVAAIQTETSTLTPTTATQTATPATGKYFTKVTVNPIPSSYIIPTGTTNISTIGGTFNVTSYASASISVPTETSTITPTEAKQTATPGTGKLLSSVTVNAISSNYIGSNITTRSSNDLTVSGGTVTAPAGYYAAAAAKSVSTATHPNPTITLNTSTGVVTASHVQSTGYVTGGTTTTTYSLTTQAAATITPTTTTQTAVSANRYTTGVVKVAAIETETSTITPNTSTQTATPATGKYFTKVTVNPIPSSYIIPTGTTTLTANGVYDVSTYASASVSINTAPTLQSKTVDPATTTQTIQPDSGYDGLSKVTVNKMPVGHVMTGGKTISAPTLTSSFNSSTGALTITSPSIDATPTINNYYTTSGYIENDSSHIEIGTVTVNSGSRTYQFSTTSATTITPTTATQTAVSAYRWTTGAVQVGPIPSEYIIPTGTTNINANGTYDVSTYASAVVSAGGSVTVQDNVVFTPAGDEIETIYPDTGYDAIGYVTILPVEAGDVRPPSTITGTSATISTGTNTVTFSKTVSATPVVNTPGYISSGTASNVSVSLTASVTTKGATTITPSTSSQTAVAANTYTTGAITVAAIPSNYIALPTSVTAGTTPVAMATGTSRIASESYIASGTKITIKKAGTYRFIWTGMRSSTSGTSGTRLYKNGTAQGTAQETWSTNIQVCTLDLACAANDEIEVYARSRGTSYYAYVPMLCACLNWNNTF